MRIFRPSEIPVFGAPITSANLRNARNHPAIDLGTCTPFQLFEGAGVAHTGTVCVIGKSARGISVAKALTRRNGKPFLFLGTAADRNSAFASLGPEWVHSYAQEALPQGNGAIYFSDPFAAYLEICTYIEGWAQDHFIILHLGNGLQAGVELMNLLSAIGQSLILCDTVPQSVRNSEAHTISPLDFMRQMQYLLVFSSGAETRALIELLPTYQYERITNTSGVSTYKSRSIFHPFRSQRGKSFSANQSRTLEFNKNVFEMDDLQRIFSQGYTLVYNALNNTVFLAQLV